jgi:prophage DNA circulation protein
MNEYELKEFELQNLELKDYSFETDEDLENAMRAQAVALIECAETVAKMNETIAGAIATMHPDVENKLEGTASILSQVLQSLHHRKEERNSKK